MSTEIVHMAALGALATRVTQQHRQPALLPALFEFDPLDQFAPQRLAELMERDPMMSRRVYQGFASQGETAGPSLTARDAIQRAGVPAVHCTVAVCATTHALEVPQRPGFRGYWNHAIATAVLGSLLASSQRIDYFEPWMAGLLLGVGRLLLAVHEPEVARSILDDARATGASAEELERTRLGCTTRDLARHLAEAWRLPPAVTEVFDAPAHESTVAAPPSAAAAARRGHAAAIRHGYPNPLDPPIDPASLPVDEHLERVILRWGDLERLPPAVASMAGSAQIPD